MGRRRYLAALGATFALLVAACAATDPASEIHADPAAESSSTSNDDAVPEALANAGFSEGGEDCIAGDNPQLILLDTQTGEEQWSASIPRPGGASLLHGDELYATLAWDREVQPGVIAFDIENQQPIWQRSLTTEPEQMSLLADSLIVVERNTIRALDLDTGDDLWVTGSEFEFSHVVLEGGWAYAINTIAVHGIDLRTGAVSWELPIERPDELVANGSLLAVAAQNRVIAVDVVGQQILWDQRVNRLGAGQMWVSPDAILVQLAPFESPAGGIAALDRGTGVERWQMDGVNEVHWPTDEVFITTRAADTFRGTLQYDLLAISATSGQVQWTVPVTAPIDTTLQSVDENSALISQPHPAVPDVELFQLLRTSNGSVVWETTIAQRSDGAQIEGAVFVSSYRTINRLDGDRGEARVILGPGRSWTASVPDGIEQDLIFSRHGVVVVSGEGSATCVGRTLTEPSN